MENKKPPRPRTITHRIRSGKFNKDGTPGTRVVTKLGRKKAIYLFCEECMGHVSDRHKLIRECTSPMCPLYPFRHYSIKPQDTV